MKILTTLYFDYDVKFDRGEYIAHVTGIFSRDHPQENFCLGTDLL